MIERVLHNHLTRYPALQIQDMYKLLHQAVLGSEHAVSNPGAAGHWLTRELAEMGDGIPEPLIDPISPDDEIVRVHLRPYIAAGHDPDLLLNAFIRTANEYHGDIRLLAEFWQEAVDMNKFPAQEMENFLITMKSQNYPAAHHSVEYEKLYRPAYRVVCLAFASGTWRLIMDK